MRMQMTLRPHHRHLADLMALTRMSDPQWKPGLLTSAVLWTLMMTMKKWARWLLLLKRAAIALTKKRSAHWKKRNCDAASALWTAKTQYQNLMDRVITR